MKPKPLSVSKPIRLIFVGGFLGSGKTTALAAIARRLIDQGNRVGIITNDQTKNLVDTLIVRRMLSEWGVPVEEVVKGCFCCKFDELIDHMEKILAHEPDFLLGEPVGSCTDFVAAVANPIKIHYRDAFRFAPFSTLVDPDRAKGILFSEDDTGFPEEVTYLFSKQLEEADVIVLNKADLIEDGERIQLLKELERRFGKKTYLSVSAKEGQGMDLWLDVLLSHRPSAGTVLAEIDYDRYARAEAVLGWLNGAVHLEAPVPFDGIRFLMALLEDLQRDFKESNTEIGHLKCVLTSGGKAAWANLTRLAGTPTVEGDGIADLKQASLIINARVRMEPSALALTVKGALKKVSKDRGIDFRVDDLQCFSPAYPEPPYLVREPVD